MGVNGNIQDSLKAGNPKPEDRKKQLRFLSTSQLCLENIKTLQLFVEEFGTKIYFSLADKVWKTWILDNKFFQNPHFKKFI